MVNNNNKYFLVCAKRDIYGYMTLVIGHYVDLALGKVLIV
jgi:hypothetical protein